MSSRLAVDTPPGSRNKSQSLRLQSLTKCCVRLIVVTISTRGLEANKLETKRKNQKEAAWEGKLFKLYPNQDPAIQSYTIRLFSCLVQVDHSAARAGPASAAPTPRKKHGGHDALLHQCTIHVHPLKAQKHELASATPVSLAWHAWAWACGLWRE